MSPTCVLWYVPCSKTGLPKHGDSEFLHFRPLNQNLACGRTSGRVCILDNGAICNLLD